MSLQKRKEKFLILNIYKKLKRFKIPEKISKTYFEKKIKNEIISEIYNLPIKDNQKTYLDTLAFRKFVSTTY